MKKRLLSFVLISLLMLSSLPFSASAESEGDYAYAVSGGEATISKYSGAETEIEIPSALGGYPVTGISERAFSGCGVVSVTIPESVTSIGEYAFRDCESLVSVDGLGGVTSVGAGLFYNCLSLRSVTLPHTVKEIGSAAFGNCSNLASAEIPEGVETIREWAFKGCGSLASVTIPDSVINILEEAFDKGVLIRCKPGSRAEAYAKNNGNAIFYLVDDPKITAQPKAVSANVGANASFTVAATGTGLTYQWQVSKDGGSSWSNTTIAGNKTKTLSFAASASFNGYLFRCAVKDINGKKLTSGAAKLTILPQITTQPKAASAAAGSTASFTVKATGAGLAYQWQVSKNGGSSWSNTTITGNKTKTLSFAASASFNGYLFRCIVTDANGKKLTSSAAKLTITPKLTAQPKAASANVSATVQFAVTATGAGLKYQWQVSKNGGGSWSNTTITGNKTKTLSFAASASFNGYLFRCVVTDANGKKLTSNAAKLTITPKITAQPQAVSVTAGSTASFAVKATGAGLTYQWQVLKKGSANWENLKTAGYDKPVFSLKPPRKQNGWKYRCVITDANGKTLASGAAALTVRLGTVYWTAGGSVYHSVRDCSSLSRSTDVRSGTVAQSGKAKGCGNCC